MNRYERMAQKHWRRWLPTRYREIPDPSSFFTTLGQQVPFTNCRQNASNAIDGRIVFQRKTIDPRRLRCSEGSTGSFGRT
jgi:hypothetical protein